MANALNALRKLKMSTLNVAAALLKPKAIALKGLDNNLIHGEPPFRNSCVLRTFWLCTFARLGLVN
jgi:hypothetical protein